MFRTTLFFFLYYYCCHFVMKPHRDGKKRHLCIERVQFVVTNKAQEHTQGSLISTKNTGTEFDKKKQERKTTTKPFHYHYSVVWDHNTNKLILLPAETTQLELCFYWNITDCLLATTLSCVNIFLQKIEETVAACQSGTSRDNKYLSCGCFSHSFLIAPRPLLPQHAPDMSFMSLLLQ